VKRFETKRFASEFKMAVQKRQLKVALIIFLILGLANLHYFTLHEKIFHHAVYLEVRDHGCGIPEENVKKVFQPFVSKKKGGTGLGLAIVKKIAEAHGGEVFLSPNEGNGVIFSIVLPVI